MGKTIWELEPRLLVAADFENNPAVDGNGYLPCWVECDEVAHGRAVMIGAIEESETMDGWTAISIAEMPGYVSYDPHVRFWTARPSAALMAGTPWDAGDGGTTSSALRAPSPEGEGLGGA